MELGPISGVSGVSRVGGSSRAQREFKRPFVPDRPRRHHEDDDAYVGSGEKFEDEAEEAVEEPAEEPAEEMTSESETSAESDADSSDAGGELNLFA